MTSIDSGVRKALDFDVLKETVAVSERKDIDLQKLLLKKKGSQIVDGAVLLKKASRKIA